MKKLIIKNVLILALVNRTSQESIDTTNDSIIIVERIEDVRGGKTLVTTDLPADMKVISAGHVVIKETATGICKALGVTGTAGNYTYNSLPSGHTYLGVVIASVLTAKPDVAILVRGCVNDVAYKNSTSLDYPAGLAAALPLIRFQKD